MKQLPWILSTLLLLIILYLLVFNKPVPSDAVPRAQFTAMEQRYNDILAAYHEFSKQSDSALDNATAIAVQANERADKSEAAVNQSLRRIDELQDKLNAADIEKPDSTWVQVSPNYKDGCDSLRKENITLNNRILEFVRDCRSSIGSIKGEVHLKDSLLDRERQFNDDFKKSLQDCIVIGKQAQKAGQPRNQLYAGFGVIGNKINPFAGGEVNLSLKTKSDQIYEVRGALILTTWYVGLGTKFKLHF